MSGPSNQAEQKERKALAGSTTATTYHSRAMVDFELDGTAGRFGKPSVVSGAQPGVNYPRLPSSSPWHSDIVPPEESLGFDINAMEAVGTPTEIEASLAGEVGTSSPPTASALVALPAGSNIGQSPDVVRPGSATTPAKATSSSPVPALVSSLPLGGNDVAIQLAEVLPKLVKRRRIV
jgi:hypothetical protein